MTTRAAVLALALLTATGAAVPLATPSTAAGEPGTTTVRLESVGTPTTRHQSQRTFAADGSSAVFGDAAPDPDRDTYGFGTSAARDRVVVRERSSSETRIVVRDASGATVAVAATDPEETGGDGFAVPATYLTGRPALTPDGTTVLWTQRTIERCGYTDSRLLARDVAGGPVRVLSATAGVGETDPVYAGDLLVVANEKPDGYADGCYGIVSSYSTRTASGEVTPVKGLESGVSADGSAPTSNGDLAFSPDGSRVAYVRFEAGGFFEQSPVGVAVAPVTRTGNTLTIGASTQLGEGRAPAFSADGSTVLFVRDGQTVAAPATGGPVTVLRSGGGLDTRCVTQLVTESQVPAAPTALGGVTRSGSTATVPFTVATDPTASVVRLTRTSPGAAPVVRQVTLPATSFTDTGLVKARSYSYAVQVQDRSGNLGPARTVSAPSTLPAAAVRVSGQQLRAGQQLIADNGTTLRLGADGNLVVRAPSGAVLFQTRTRATGAQLRVQGDGNVVLVDSRGRPVWRTGTAGAGSVVLVVQPDGNAVVYRDRDGRAVWSSRAARR